MTVVVEVVVVVVVVESVCVSGGGWVGWDRVEIGWVVGL